MTPGPWAPDSSQFKAMLGQLMFWQIVSWHIDCLESGFQRVCGFGAKWVKAGFLVKACC